MTLGHSWLSFTFPTPPLSTKPGQLQSHQRLRPWLDFANLLPPPPSRKELERAPNGLILSSLATEWRKRCRAERPSEFVRRFERSHLAQMPAITGSLDLPLLRVSPMHARRFLELAVEIADTFRTLAAATLPHVVEAAGDTPLLIRQLYETLATSRSEVWIWNGAVATRWVDPFTEFLAALQGVEATRVCQCPVCNRVFFALRKDQKACSKRCNAARRVRDWRANQAQHEYRRKLRTAGLLAQKVKRRRARKPSLLKR